MEEFLSTPSARRATYELRRENQQYKRFLSTPSARRATRQDSRQKLGHTISIHALREEGDGGILFRPVMAADDFYPRPPRGGRPIKKIIIYFFVGFLSTPSARRATLNTLFSPFGNGFLSTPSARRATARGHRFWCVVSEFLSTPSARRATVPSSHNQPDHRFLSTPSARRATAKTEKNISAFVSL